MNFGKTRLAAALIAGILGVAGVAPPNGDIPFFVPEGWPRPAYPLAVNPVTTAGFELGRRLFYDPLLSRDTTISCASCHLQATGFAHVDHTLSHGIEGRIGLRNAPAIQNMAWNTSFMWDGGVNHLDVQPLAPITNQDEMDENMAHVVQKLNNNLRYRGLFQMAFGDSIATGQRVLLALSQFVIELNSYNARYDQVMRGEPGVVFTAQESNGLALFRRHCAQCHTEPLFTDQSFAANGLPPDPDLKDYGRMRITGQTADSLRFKVPTLRNIQFTYPYMHDGRFKKLPEVIRHYTTLSEQDALTDARLAQPIALSHAETIDLIAFLYTLTDRDFLFDPRFGFPRD